MKNIIIMSIIYICICLNSFGINCRADYSYFNEDVIANTTTRTSFSLVGITIYGKNIDKDSYFVLEGNSGLNGNFVIGENLQMTSPDNNIIGNKALFRDKEGKIVSEIKLDIKGNMLFNWKNKSKRADLLVGKIYNSRGSSEDVYINLKEIAIINTLKVNVEDHMDLGVIIAGEEADTEKSSNAKPAKLNISGEMGKNVKISMPNSIKIRNEKNDDELNVDLRFRENRSNEITKTFNTLEKNNQGIIRDFYIDGNIKTSADDYGTYNGSFIVRVEYEN